MLDGWPLVGWLLGGGRRVSRQPGSQAGNHRVGEPGRSTVGPSDGDDHLLGSQQRLTPSPGVDSQDPLAPLGRSTSNLQYLGFYNESISTYSGGQKARGYLGDHEAVALGLQVVKANTGLVEQFYAASFEELHVDAVVQVAVGIQFVEPDLDGMTVGHGGDANSHPRRAPVPSAP